MCGDVFKISNLRSLANMNKQYEYIKAVINFNTLYLINIDSFFIFITITIVSHLQQ